LDKIIYIHTIRRSNMLIPCSENCIYQEDGMCNLTKVTSSSSTPLKDCPYFVDRDRKKDKDKMEKE
jgi:hypothetical protein